jgi:ComF family protein
MKSGETKTVESYGFLSPLSFIYDSCLTLIYPQTCKKCSHSVESQTDGFVCDNCWRQTRLFYGQEISCRKCSAFLRNGPSDSVTFCRRCETDEYDFARAVGLYENALLISVLTLKTEPFIPRRLENLLISVSADPLFQDAERIVPVPLSKQRLKSRGFNQASVIARLISKQTNIPIDETSLVRTRHTEKHRAGMDRKARSESVENAFEVKRPRIIEGKNILLVDDVFTSGATVSNCARALKKSGACKVYVLTIARAF